MSDKSPHTLTPSTERTHGPDGSVRPLPAAAWRRFRRRFLNPTPGPGQDWSLDGVGEVEVLSVSTVPGAPPRVKVAASDGEELSWKLSRFVTQADLLTSADGETPAPTFPWIKVAALAGSTGAIVAIAGALLWGALG